MTGGSPLRRDNQPVSPVSKPRAKKKKKKKVVNDQIEPYDDEDEVPTNKYGNSVKSPTKSGKKFKDLNDDYNANNTYDDHSEDVT